MTVLLKLKQDYYYYYYYYCIEQFCGINIWITLFAVTFDKELCLHDIILVKPIFSVLYARIF